MSLKIKNFLSSTLGLLSFLFIGLGSVFAQSSTSTATSKTSTSGVLWLAIVWWIISWTKRKAIGGWLVLYYIQLYIWLFSSLLLLFGSFDGISILPIIILIFETIFASLLLSKHFRNRKIYNYFMITLVIDLIIWLIYLLINLSYSSTQSALDIYNVVVSSLWLLYFIYSKRVKMVFVDNKWDPNILFWISKNNSKPIRWENKITQIAVSEDKLWKRIVLDGNEIQLKKDTKIWDMFTFKWKWMISKNWWESGDITYVVVQITNPKLPKGEDKIVKIDISKDELWKEVEYEWDVLFFKKNAHIWDKFVVSKKWYFSESWWESWDLIYVIAQIL